MDARTRLDELARGYQSSIVILTAAKIGLFAAMGEAACPVADLALKLECDRRALEIVMLALAADELLLLEEGQFKVNPDYAPYLLPDRPTTQASIINHNYRCMLRWATLEQVLRTGSPAPREPRRGDELRDFILGMANISRESSLEVAEKVDLAPFGRMLDLGGGPGTSAIVFARHYPQLSAVVFDLEGAIEIAKEEIAKAGLSERIATKVGDYYRDEFGSGYDLIYVSNIIHSLAYDDVRMLARKSYRALDPGGAVIVKEFFLDDSRTQPPSAARFSVNMLVSTAGGKSYTFTEAEEILTEAGFGEFSRTPVATHSALLIARKPATA